MIDPSIQRSIEQMAARAQELSGKLQNLSATGSDDKSLITVTCGPGGKLTDIEFDPRARRLESFELREAVLQAAERAAAEVQNQMTGAMSDVTGGMDFFGADVTKQAEQSMSEYKTLIDEQMKKVEEIRASVQSFKS